MRVVAQTGIPRDQIRWRRWVEIGAIAVASVFAGQTLLWLMLDRLPPNWDDAWYLTNSLVVYDGLTADGIGGYLKAMNTVFGFKAPLIAGLPSPFYLVAGRKWQAAYGVNLASMLLLGWTIYRIGRSWWGERAGLVAVAVSCTMPLLYGLSRWYLVEYPLAAAVSMAMWLLMESEGLERRDRTVAFGVLGGVGMLLKVSFAAFVLPAYLYVLARARQRGRALGLTAIPCLAVAGPWYAGHLGPTLRNAVDAGFGQPATVQGTGPVFEVGTMATYLGRLLVNGIGEYYGMLGLALAGWMAVRGRGRGAWMGNAGQGSTLLILWVLPFTVFLFGGNKDIRYIGPIVPAVALVVGGLVDTTLPRTGWGNAVAVLLLVFPVAQSFAVSFGVPYRTAGLTYARRFEPVEWPHEEMLRAIAARSSLRQGERQTLLVGADRGGLNANNVELGAVAMRLHLDVETTAHERNLDLLRERLAHCAYFLYEEGGEGESAVFNPFASEVVRVAKDGGYREIYSGVAPDHGVVHVVERAAAYRSADEIQPGMESKAGAEEIAIDFGGMLGITRVGTTGTKGAVRVELNWRCVRPPSKEYWCFMHLIDGTGKIIGQLDHRLLGGERPLERWHRGDGGKEELRLVVPEGKAGSGLRLRFGLYDPPTGERIAVRTLRGFAAGQFEVADNGTAVVSKQGIRPLE